MILKKIIAGMWLKPEHIKDQDIIEFVSGVSEETSQFKNKDGSQQMQKVIMVKTPEGKTYKVGLKSQAINNMIDAYGENGDGWTGKHARVWIREYQGKNGEWKDGIYLTAPNKNLKGELTDGSIPAGENIPVIELPKDKEEIDIKNIPF